MNGEELQAELHRRNLTHAQAADVLGVSRVSVTRYCTNATTITDDRADLIRLRLDQYDRERREKKT